MATDSQIPTHATALGVADPQDVVYPNVTDLRIRDRREGDRRKSNNQQVCIKCQIPRPASTEGPCQTPIGEKGEVCGGMDFRGFHTTGL